MKKKRTKVITIALSLALLTLGGLASIPADGTTLAGKVFLADDTDTDDDETEPDTDNTGGNGYILTRNVCTRVWYCPNGTVELTYGRSFHCSPANGFTCTSEDESGCDAERPDCLRF